MQSSVLVVSERRMVLQQECQAWSHLVPRSKRWDDAPEQYVFIHAFFMFWLILNVLSLIEHLYEKITVSSAQLPALEVPYSFTAHWRGQCIWSSAFCQTLICEKLWTTGPHHFCTPLPCSAPQDCTAFSPTLERAAPWNLLTNFSIL